MKEKDDLLAAARDAMLKAYCPYSKFQVGAALLCEDGSIVTGCNVENASYGLTICAERTAIFRAVALGKQRFSAMAIVASGDTTPHPCGACRQVLSEFCDGSFAVYAAAADATDADQSTLGELLPKSFQWGQSAS